MPVQSSTLGPGGKLGMVMPLRWWFQGVAPAAPQPQTPPAQSPVGPVGGSDLPRNEPPAPASTQSTIATSPVETKGGKAGTDPNQHRRDNAELLGDRGEVDNLKDFVKAASMSAIAGPAGPFRALATLAAGAITGNSPLDVNNPNKEPGYSNAVEKAALAGAQPAAALQAGKDFIAKNRKPGTTTSGPGSSGGGRNDNGRDNPGVGAGSRNSRTGQLGHI